MINCNAEFYQGVQGKLFRLKRTPDQTNAHIIYIAPLFEQANQTRHMYTRSAMNVYFHGVESIIYDHFGSGDSAGELIDATLELWQQDLTRQIREIKLSSSKPIFLSVLLSAGLLLNDEILSLVDGVLLTQPDFNGKSFTRQLKRMAIAGSIVKTMTDDNVENIIHGIVDIAGYQFTQQLFDDLAKQNSSKISQAHLTCIWFEWLVTGNELIPSRAKQQQAFQLNCPQTEFVMVDDVKYWQATELQLAQDFLQQEQQVIKQLLVEYNKGEKD